MINLAGGSTARQFADLPKFDPPNPEKENCQWAMKKA
jgi:hypothetical protein